MKLTGEDVFVAGPMESGDWDDVERRFAAARERCKRSGAGWVETMPSAAGRYSSWERKTRQVLKSFPASPFDHLVLMPGWEASPTCCIVADMAQLLGTPRMALDEVDPYLGPRGADHD